MAKYLSKRAIEQIKKLSNVAAEDKSRYRIDEVRFEPDEGGMIGVATDGVLMVATMIDEADAPQLIESDVGSFPDWRGVLPELDEKTTLIRVNPRLLIRALEAVMSMTEDEWADDENYCDSCGERFQFVNSVVLAIPANEKAPLGICCNDQRAIASLMRITDINRDNVAAYETMQRTIDLFKKQAEPTPPIQKSGDE